VSRKLDRHHFTFNAQHKKNDLAIDLDSHPFKKIESCMGEKIEQTHSKSIIIREIKKTEQRMFEIMIIGT